MSRQDYSGRIRRQGHITKRGKGVCTKPGGPGGLVDGAVEGGLSVKGRVPVFDGEGTGQEEGLGTVSKGRQGGKK